MRQNIPGLWPFNLGPFCCSAYSSSVGLSVWAQSKREKLKTGSWTRTTIFWGKGLFVIFERFSSPHITQYFLFFSGVCFGSFRVRWVFFCSRFCSVSVLACYWLLLCNPKAIVLHFESRFCRFLVAVLVLFSVQTQDTSFHYLCFWFML